MRIEPSRNVFQVTLNYLRFEDPKLKFDCHTRDYASSVARAGGALKVSVRF